MARREYREVEVLADNNAPEYKKRKAAKKLTKKLIDEINEEVSNIENDSTITDDIQEMRDVFEDENNDTVEENYVCETSSQALIGTLKSFVSILAQLQKTRIATCNRLYSAVATAYGLSNEAPHAASELPTLEVDEDGIPVDTKKNKKGELQKKVINALKEDYKLINDSVMEDIYSRKQYRAYKDIDLPFASFELAKRTVVNNTILKLLNTPEDRIRLKYLKEFPLYALTGVYLSFEEMEKRHTDQLKKLLEEIPVYKYYLKHIHGCGTSMSAAILSKLDYTKATVSNWLGYCGMDVVIDPETGIGYGRSKRKEHLVVREFKRKDGTIETKQSVTFNPWIKSKLLGVLPTTIGKGYGVQKKKNDGSHESNFYWKIWLEYRNRLQNDPARKQTRIVVDKKGKEKEFPIFPPARIAAMSNRYMVKWFLIDLYVNWRAIEGLTSREPYQDEKLHNDDGSKHVSRIRTVDYIDPDNPKFVEIPWSEHDDPRYLCSSKFDRSLLK